MGLLTPTLRRKVRERHGEKSKRLEGVSTMVWCTSAVRERRARQLTAAKEGFRGGIMLTTMEAKQGKLGCQLVKTQQVHG